MSDSPDPSAPMPVPAAGSIAWADLTVPDAVRVRDFYAGVVGWTVTPVDMDGYEDFCLNEPASGRTVAGVCHARGSNANLPPVWLLYVTVADLDASLARVAALGGAPVTPVRDMGGSRMAVVRDPAGAMLALFQPAAAPPP